MESDRYIDFRLDPNRGTAGLVNSYLSGAYEAMRRYQIRRRYEGGTGKFDPLRIVLAPHKDLLARILKVRLPIYSVLNAKRSAPLQTVLLRGPSDAARAGFFPFRDQVPHAIRPHIAEVDSLWSLRYFSSRKHGLIFEVLRFKVYINSRQHAVVRELSQLLRLCDERDVRYVLVHFVEGCSVELVDAVCKAAYEGVEATNAVRGLLIAGVPAVVGQFYETLDEQTRYLQEEADEVDWNRAFGAWEEENKLPYQHYGSEY